MLIAFFSLATGSLLIPIPEEVLVGVIGFSSYLGAGSTAEATLFLAVALLPCCLAVVCGDVLIWLLGSRLGLAARGRFKFLARAATDKRVAAVEGLLRRYGALAIMVARLVPGARICTFFVAGALRMPLSRFALFDFLGSLVSVTLCLTLGALAAHEDYGATWAREAAGSAASIVILAISALGLAAWAGLAIVKRAQKKSATRIAGLPVSGVEETVIPHAAILTQD